MSAKRVGCSFLSSLNRSALAEGVRGVECTQVRQGSNVVLSGYAASLLLPGETVTSQECYANGAVNSFVRLAGRMTAFIIERPG